MACSGLMKFATNEEDVVDDVLFFSPSRPMLLYKSILLHDTAFYCILQTENPQTIRRLNRYRLRKTRKPIVTTPRLVALLVIVATTFISIQLSY